ncbi:hypothetical protein MUCCIDRAFT_115737 [Mucor lusitanicus CBS 277.49]|uniref:Uncharacterized protein n=2 Tax=Mucor circinelloides f. lusitanicus TaxID=29924 RepID=A0A168GZX4_MUCCL|nr:hypothetical protein MUCCIDRAFT_115737 [Mucor lusitanicus CBS 277.49]
MGRQSPGRKMDYLFITKQTDFFEVGCGECALVGGVKTTKELVDAGFKMAKIMRDMMFKIVKESPGLLHKLHMTGFYIADNMQTLWILYAPPLGYISRCYAFLPVQYPTTESKFAVV